MHFSQLLPNSHWLHRKIISPEIQNMSAPSPFVESPFVKIDGNDQGYLIHGAPFTLSFHFPGATVVWVHNPLPKTRRIDWPMWVRGWHRCKATDQWTGTANYYHPFLQIRTLSWHQFWKSGAFRFRLKIDFPNVLAQDVHSHLRAQEIDILNKLEFQVNSTDFHPNCFNSSLILHRPGVFRGLPEPMLIQKPGRLKPMGQQPLKKNKIYLDRDRIETDYPLTTNLLSNI